MEQGHIQLVFGSGLLEAAIGKNKQQRDAAREAMQVTFEDALKRLLKEARLKNSPAPATRRSRTKR